MASKRASKSRVRKIPSVGRILVVYKTSALEKHGPRGSAAARAIMIAAHDQHLSSLDTIREVLEETGISHRFVHRSSFVLPRTLNADLIITVGGDGTLLSTSSRVADAPVLGVNSAPTFSVGFFCACAAPSFKKTLTDYLAGKARTLSIGRLKVSVGGHTISERVLNDVLVTQQNPAATSRYVIRVGRHEELQRSSGIWISTAAGSTAAIAAAGGKRIALTRREFQYVIREPFGFASRFRMTRGLLRPTQTLEVESRMEGGRLYIDGPRNSYPFPIGEIGTFEARGVPLNVVGLKNSRKR